MNRERILLVAACLLLPGGAALPHHGPYGQYALDERVDFAGTVAGIEWTNPHAFVLVESSFAGDTAIYRIELRELRQLHDLGWTGDELEIGTDVRVENAALHSDEASRLVCCARIYGDDGTEYFTAPRTQDRSDTQAYSDARPERSVRFR